MVARLPRVGCGLVVYRFFFVLWLPFHARFAALPLHAFAPPVLTPSVLPRCFTTTFCWFVTFARLHFVSLDWVHVQFHAFTALLLRSFTLRFTPGHFVRCGSVLCVPHTTHAGAHLRIWLRTFCAPFPFMHGLPTTADALRSPFAIIATHSCPHTCYLTLFWFSCGWFAFCHGCCFMRSFSFAFSFMVCVIPTHTFTCYLSHGLHGSGLLSHGSLFAHATRAGWPHSSLHGSLSTRFSGSPGWFSLPWNAPYTCPLCRMVFVGLAPPPAGLAFTRHLVTFYVLVWLRSCFAHAGTVSRCCVHLHVGYLYFSFTHCVHSCGYAVTLAFTSALTFGSRVPVFVYWFGSRFLAFAARLPLCLAPRSARGCMVYVLHSLFVLRSVSGLPGSFTHRSTHCAFSFALPRGCRLPTAFLDFWTLPHTFFRLPFSLRLYTTVTSRLRFAVNAVLLVGYLPHLPGLLVHTLVVCCSRAIYHVTASRSLLRLLVLRLHNFTHADPAYVSPGSFAVTGSLPPHVAYAHRILRATRFTRLRRSFYTLHVHVPL